METQTFDVIGIMSGTSLDGIDLAFLQFEKKSEWSFKILQCETIPYTPAWQQKLAQLTSYNYDELHKLDQEYTWYLAQQIIRFCERHQLDNSITICSHGHTALHQPDSGITYQLGNLPELAIKTSRRVICDFRTQDVALGGQGAPLVPIGDLLLFNNYAACLNLGGFANVCLKTAKGIEAFDITAVNTVLNTFAQELGQPYDTNGALARSGQVIPELLQTLAALAYYQKPAPKSLGVEWITKELSPLIARYSYCKTVDLLHTYTKHCAAQIGKVLPEGQSVLVTGGGAFNTFLMESIADFTTAQVEVPAAALVNFKEALIFGFLGVLKLLDQPNCLAAVTGAAKDHVAGRIFYPSS